MSDQLPGADQALIDPRKLRDYALNAEHHSGRYKAAFFAQMGYTAENWQELERDIRVQHLMQPAEPGSGRLSDANSPLREHCGVRAVRYAK